MYAVLPARSRGIRLLPGHRRDPAARTTPPVWRDYRNVRSSRGAKITQLDLRALLQRWTPANCSIVIAASTALS